MLRNGIVTKLLLISMAILMISATDFPGQIQRSTAQGAGEDDPPTTTYYSVHLPVVLHIHPITSSLAVETHLSIEKNSPATSRLVELNTGWVRLSGRISWRELQPNEGDPINWSLLVDTENELRILQELGRKPIIVLNDSPSWALDQQKARDANGDLTSCGPIADDKFDDFAAFVQQIVERYKTDEFNVHDWELGNEPDVDPHLVPGNSIYGCWGDIADEFYGGEHYGEMLKVVTPAIRQEDPQAKVWTGGLVISTPETTDPDLGKPELFLKGILEAGAAPYFDILPFHGHTKYYGAMIDAELYLSGPWNELGGGVRGKIYYLRDIMQSYKVDKPMVINEVGVGCDPIYDYCTPPIDRFYDYQADMLVRIATRVLSENVIGFTWYTLEGPGWRYQGLLDEFFNPQKAFVSYRELNRQTPGTTYIGTVDYGPGFEAYAFQQNPNQILHIVWAIDDITLTLSTPTDTFINARRRIDSSIVNIDPSDPVDGNYQFQVGFSPLFLIVSP